MALLFSNVCTLLDELDRQQRSSRPQTQKNQTIKHWFSSHRAQIDALGTDACALLSALLPQRRSDRVFAIKNRLESRFCEAQHLGASRLQELQRYRRPGSGVDLADCIEEQLKRTPNPSSPSALTLLDVDNVLQLTASRSCFSSPAVRTTLGRTSMDVIGMYRAATANEAKWFTRLLFKDLGIEIDEFTVLAAYHYCFPHILKFNDDLLSATRVYHEFIAQGAGTAVPWSEFLATNLKPVLGTKVGRPFWRKGRSIEHCVKMGNGQKMSVEKKLDGEFCQIHIDLFKGSRCIQIFSRSGKDSTADRLKIHSVVYEALKIGEPDCKLKRGCILEGELLAYCDKKQEILPFHKIRSHVFRRGIPIGLSHDEKPKLSEHLMVVFYDALLIDNESLLSQTHSQRMDRLAALVATRPGYAELVPRQVIDFGRPDAALDLEVAFNKVVEAGEEGLVLKPDDPFIDFGPNAAPMCGSPIKLKQQYIGAFGEIGDFAAVGARYDPQAGRQLQMDNLQWTHFYLGCLENRDEVVIEKAKPRFRIVMVVEPPADIIKQIRATSPATVAIDDNTFYHVECARGIDQGRSPSHVFAVPLVFDIHCFMFDKPSCTGFWSPRFPRVSHFHTDRDFLDCMSFAEMQRAAEAEAPDSAVAAAAGGDGVGEKPQAASSTSQHVSSGQIQSSDASWARNSPARSHGELKKAAAALDVGVKDMPPVSLPKTVSDSVGTASKKRPLADASCSGPILKRPSPALASRAPREQTLGKCKAVPDNATVIEILSSPEPEPEPDPEPSSPIDSSLCQAAGNKCRFRSYAVMLSPCISQMPYVTQNLMQAHGIGSFATDISEWRRDIPPNKICFVESQRRAATRDFMAAIETDPLIDETGGRKYIEFYDWRFLEQSWKMEQEEAKKTKKNKQSGTSPKNTEKLREMEKRWWVGLV